MPASSLWAADRATILQGLGVQADHLMADAIPEVAALHKDGLLTMIEAKQLPEACLSEYPRVGCLAVFDQRTVLGVLVPQTRWQDHS